jgi:fumarate hydratase, class I
LEEAPLSMRSNNPVTGEENKLLVIHNSTNNNRSQQVTDACKKYGGFYLGSIGGPAAILAQNNIKSIECVEYPELGMEAIWKIEVEDFPAFILVDDKGNDFFKQLKPRCLGNCK